MAWMDNLGIPLADSPETGEVDLLGSGIPFVMGVSIVSNEETDRDVPPAVYKDIDMGKLKVNNYPEKYIAPSHIGQQNQGTVELVASRGERIPLQGHPEMSEIGNCIHNI